MTTVAEAVARGFIPYDIATGKEIPHECLRDWPDGEGYDVVAPEGGEPIVQYLASDIEWRRPLQERGVFVTLHPSGTIPREVPMTRETDETRPVKTTHLFICTMSMRRADGTERADFLFMRARDAQHAAEMRQQSGDFNKDGHYGPIVEIPDHAAQVVETVLMRVMNEHPNEGRPLFCYVAETSGGGYTASTLTHHENALGFDDVVRMAGDVGESHGTPGEALQSLAVGLDRVLADAAWRQRMGEPPAPARKASEPEVPPASPSER